MDLAVLASAVGAVLADQPFSVAKELDPGAIHQQVQRPRCAAVGDLHSKGLLPPAQGGEVRHRPIQSCHLQDAGHHARSLPEWQSKEHLHHQAELDRRIGKYRRAAATPHRVRQPHHVLVQPDQQRAAPPQGLVVRLPVRRAVARSLRFAHAEALTLPGQPRESRGTPSFATTPGHNPDAYKIAAFTISGAAAGIAAIVYLLRLNIGSPIAGIGYELNAIAAVIIGGTSLFGGKGSIIGTLAGACILQVLATGLQLLGVGDNYKPIIIGAVIILAVIVDTYRDKLLREMR